MPKRMFAGALVTAAAAAALTLSGCSGGSTGASGGLSVTPAPAPTTSTPPATDTGSATTTPSPSRTAFRTTTDPHPTPWTDHDADFGWVRSAKPVSGGVEITFDRATWLLPDQVAAWNTANPGHRVVAADDYAIGNVSTRLRTFLVRRDAVIFGSVALTGNEAPSRMTAAALAQGVAANPDGVTCWLFHQYGGLTGDVVQLEEQFRP